MNSNAESRGRRIWTVSLSLLLLLLANAAISSPVFAVSQGGHFSLFTTAQQTDSGTVRLMRTTSISSNSQQGGGQGSQQSSQITHLPANLPEFSKPALVPGDTALTQGGPVAAPVAASASTIGGSGGSTGAKGLNAYDSGAVNGFDVEPPDQGLCAGNGYVLEVVNLVLAVYSTSFDQLSSPTALATFANLPVSKQFVTYLISDPRCAYDTGTGRWFLSFLYLSFGPRPNSGPLRDFAFEFVAVSATDSPLGSWNLYALDVSNDPLASNCPCFGDQPLLGIDKNSVIISTNEFPIFANGFNGAQVYLFDKHAMAEGDRTVNFVHFNLGLGVSNPDGSCAASGGLFCWYSVNPATSPTADSFDGSNGGTAWAMSSLDFTGEGDNRIAVWAFSGTSSLQSSPSVSLSVYLGRGLESYYNPGALVPQKVGPIPAGDTIWTNGTALNTALGFTHIGCPAQCSVGPLASNGDGMWDTVVYAQGAVWGAVNTLVNEGTQANPDIHMGAAFWIVNAAGNSVSLSSQGYAAASGQELLFPSVAAGPAGSGIIVFTLTGKDYFPSTAFGIISKGSNGLAGNTIYVADLGQAPQDGFTEYLCIATSSQCPPGSYRPRWGDYTWAVWSGGKIFFSSEYIQYQACSDSAFVSDPTCGGTRDPFANWGTSLNVVTLDD